ncbi:MAG: hypothetical protein KJ868_13130 [Gammaproteobacteria bacterium]|nr:hypothetical protein [Gammaproteobacteria bacterium]MBU2238944.1 hypothetical protein [Gammaproteobacteria bacterium]
MIYHRYTIKMTQSSILTLDQITLNVMTHNRTKNALIESASSVVSFGFFPENNNGFPSAKICLKLGFIGSGKGRAGAYGLRHIFEKHGGELGMTCPSEVVSYVKSIIKPGSEILVDYKKEPDRPLVIESSTGLIVLALAGVGESKHYNIISAYTRFSHPGTVIATIT